ncbi:hyaluronan-mediated motility receptor [Biomphalaria glabrata]|nr:hyaluronan-mediated motility receptor [Biomphalaria glabrata]
MKNTGLEEDRKALSCQLEDEKEKAERHVAELLEEKVRLNDIIAVLQTESLALKNQLTNSVQECQVLSTQLNEKNVKYLEMKSTISRLYEEVTYLENTKASLEMERDSISSSMMEEREKFHNECSVLTSSILELQTTVTNSEGKNNVLNKTVLELQSKNAHLENDMNIISSQLDAERVKSAKKNFELKSTISALQEESQAEKDQLKMTISAFQEESQVEKDQLKMTISALQEESQAEKDQLKAAISELQNDTIEFKEKLDYTKQECPTVLSQLHKERESLNSYKLENSQMKSTILNKEKEIADLKAEIRNLANTLVESEYIRNDLEKGKNVLSSCLADEREQFKKECSVLNSSVAELTQKLEHCENERSNLNQTIQELKTMIVHSEKDKEALSSQLEENWKLIKKIEPFRDVLDNFQMEKKFLLERDKYTSEKMERLTKEAIKNMGHQNHHQKVKYVKTLKKIAPVIATTHCDSSKMTQTPGEPRIPFKGKKMLSESECMCPVYISLIIQPVTFPCNHSLCLQCYKETVEKANLSCPVCRKRISVWARKAAKENKLINMEKWTDIQEAFPEKVRRRLEASEESDKEDEEDEFEAKERRQISCPGEIRQEYEAAIQQIQQRKDEEAKKEEEASKALVEALQQEEFLSEKVEIEEKALVLEKKKSKKIASF